MRVTGWKSSPLPSLLMLMKSGGTPRTSRSDFYGGEIPFVAIEDLTACSKYLRSTVKTLTPEGLKNSNAWLVPEESILYSIYATLGVPRINKVAVATNQAILAMIVRPDFVDRDFLFYWFEYVRDSVVGKNSSQTTQKNLSGTIVRTLVVEHPSAVSEQSKIAEILSTMDRAIEQTEALIAKQQRIKAGLMQDLLTRGIDEHGNLRSERTHEFKDSPLGRIPAAWTIDTLNRCVRADAPICYGILMPGGGYDNGVPVIKVRDIVGGKVLQGDLLLTDPRIDRQYSRSRLCAGDLLITIRGTTGRIARVPTELEGANITQDTARVRLAARCSLRFFYYLLQSTAVQAQISLHTIGQAVKGINIGDVKRLQVVTPLHDEQEQIADRLEATDATLFGAQHELGKFRLLKTALMQDLLTGKRRVTALLSETEARA